MRDFRVDGIRMDSVENVANWDFIQTYKDRAHQLFEERCKVAGMPSTVFVDRKGNVRVMHKGYKPGDENFYLTQIRSMLKE